MKTIETIIEEIGGKYKDAINSVIAKKGNNHDKELAREWLESTLAELVDDFEITRKWGEKCNDYLRVWFICLPDEDINKIDKTVWKLIALIIAVDDLSFIYNFADICLQELPKNLRNI